MKTINPAASPYADAAKVLIDKIHALRDEIPRFTPKVDGQRVAIGVSGRLGDDALETTSVVLARSRRLEVAAGTDAATLRDSYAYVLAYRQVAKELAAMAKAMQHSLTVERALAGASALDIYAIARRLVKYEDGAELLPFVEDMRKSLKTKQPRKTNSSSDSAPAVTPAPSQK
jgi:hypothetical protein